MKTAEIPRLNFETLTLTDARVDLARAAQEKLGYKKLAQAIAIPGALLYQLRELAITPLVTARVQQYQASKVRKGMWSGTKEFWCAFAFEVFVVTLFIYSMRGAFNEKVAAFSSLHGGLNFVLGCIMVIGFAYTAFGAWLEIGHGKRIITEWAKAHIATYKGNVPEFALSKAIEIKNALPAVDFKVEYLVEHHEEKIRPLPDPFLVAYLGDEEYYIEVWDEKEYEVKM